MAWIIKMKVCLQYVVCQSAWHPGYLASMAICSVDLQAVFVPTVLKRNASCDMSRYSAVRYGQKLGMWEGKEPFSSFPAILFNYKLFFFFLFFLMFSSIST